VAASQIFISHSAKDKKIVDSFLANLMMWVVLNLFLWNMKNGQEMVDLIGCG
jgi:hypothetical protein